MIIFFESGRLGNQLFQYCAMRKYSPQGPILVVGMDDLKAGFNGVDLAGSTRFGRLLVHIIRRVGERRIAFFAKRMRIISVVEEDQRSIGPTFNVTPGLLKSVAYFKAGFYQSENTLETAVVSKLSVKPEVVERARCSLSDLPCSPQNRYFVHIRRGDYLQWPSCSAPAVLPLNWYKKQIARIQKTNPNAFFLIFSDDQPYAQEFFSDVGSVVIVNGDTLSDFAAMTLCLGGGVLSASSFSWWVAYFIRQANPRAFFLAPTYWGGHRQMAWHPKAIKTSWLTYVDVH